MRSFILAIFSGMLMLYHPPLKDKADLIVGLWNNDDRNLRVSVYRTGEEYRAKIVWFDDSDDLSQPMLTRKDYNNPDPTFQSRAVLNLEIMRGLRYNAQKDIWEGGIIYDPSSGKEWRAKAWLSGNDALKVRGFWHFEWLGQNIGFSKHVP